ncbi:MAG: DUF1080 domain-containing protein [bacterium]
MTYKSIIYLLCGFLLLVNIEASAQSREKIVENLLNQLPAQNEAQFNRVHQQILDAGADVISRITAQVLPPAEGDDTNARFALSGLAKYVSQTKNEQQREMLVHALIQALESNEDIENQAFFMSLIQLIGRDESIAPLSRFLHHPQLFEPATQALIAINSPASAAAILLALPEAKPAARPTLIKALGDLRSSAAVHELMKHANAGDLNTRLMTYYALASIGDPSAVSVLRQAYSLSEGYERSQIISSGLLLAERLSRNGSRKIALDLYRSILDREIPPERVNLHSQALCGIVNILGEDAMPDLFAAMDHPSPAFRKTALDLVRQFPGQELTWRWIDKARNSAPPIRQEIIAMLGERGDVIALPFILYALREDPAGSRSAAIQAAAELGNVECLPVFMELLNADLEDEELTALKTALLQMPGEYSLSVLAARLPQTPPSVRIALLDVLAERKARPHLQVAFDQVNAQDSSVRRAAIRTLGELAGLNHLPQLTDLLLHAPDNEVEPVKRAVLSVLGQARDRNQQVVLLSRQFDKVDTARKHLLLDLLTSIGGGRALHAALPCLENDELRKQAIDTVLALVLPRGERDRGMQTPLAYQALKKVQQLTDDEEIQERVVKHLATQPKPDEDGFISLFNGRNLNGWIGDIGGYAVEDGVLICKPGGNLYTDTEYKDFIFRFEFKLPPGGNNGVGIRAPLEGDAAYTGMEIQILDHDHPMYKNIQPYQAHGSVYGIVPAKRGFLKPAGQWNREEIIVNGREIKVILNGETIVDAHLDLASTPKTLDGREHPGVKRAKGHIGFLGHGSPVEFRNISVKELNVDRPDNTAPEGFTALFNGKDLTNWKGLVANPVERAKMTEEELADAQKKADERMREHWKVQDGTLVFDGKGDSLCTVRDYCDFEMFVDWKILKDGDSGIYLRGSPQVQIWDRPDIGSGALFNNQNNPSTPLKVADNPIGEWNTFHIIMIGDRLTVYLNDELVTDNVLMENYWERDKPIYPCEQIELQNHGNTLYFKNIYIRELSQDEKVAAH